MQARIDSMPNLRTPGKLFSATYMAGTPGNSVGFSRRMVCSTCSASKRGSKIMLAPMLTARFMAEVMPYTWLNGTTQSIASLPSRTSVSQRRTCMVLATKL